MVGLHATGRVELAFDGVQHGREPAPGRPTNWGFLAAQSHLAESATDIETPRLLVLAAAREINQGREPRKMIFLFKAQAAEMLGGVAERTVQVLRGPGACPDLPMERIYRDCRGLWGLTAHPRSTAGGLCGTAWISAGRAGYDIRGVASMQGETISHYRITEELGRGGMSVVYRAEDTKLNRAVALKFLSGPELASGESKARFLQEAQASAALSHPHIIGIHEIDEVGGRLFLVLPLLEGESLEKRIARGPIEVSTALEIALQIAEALEEAHAKGIVHRDIKPSNVMVQDKGPKLRCILMDFGLARLAQTTRLTRAGSQLGTAAYMSPEQIQGESVDHRTDIWSLGVVLYEMVSGALPFPSDYEQALFYRVLNEDPEPLTALRTGVPPELERIVSKCIAKDAGERYQSSTDLRVDLRTLQKSTATGTSRPSAVFPLPVSTKQDAPWYRQLASPQALVGLLLGALLTGAASWSMLASRSSSGWTPQYSIERLTWNSGLSTHPDISSDGRLVAYASDRDGGGHLDIWVEQTGGGGRVQVTDAAEEGLTPKFSPDGATLLFERDGDLYAVPALGGRARFLAGQASLPAFSPDGAEVSYASPGGELMVVDLAGGEPRKLQAGFQHMLQSLWMPDGEQLLFSAVDKSNEFDLWVTPAAGGERYPLRALEFVRTTHSTNRITFLPAWAEPGRSLLYGSQQSLWNIELRSDLRGFAGPPRALTFGPSGFYFASVADDGTIAAAAAHEQTGIWSAPSSAGPRDPLHDRIGTPTVPLRFSLSRAKNRLAFVGRTNSSDVYVHDLGNGEETNITNDGREERNAVISADGTQVAYESRSGAEFELRVFSFESQQSRTLCDNCGTPSHWSPDGAYILVTQEEREAIARIDSATGDSVDIIAFEDTPGIESARYSPDGRWIAFAERNSPHWTGRVLVAPADASSVIGESACIQVTETSHLDVMPRWSPAGDAIYYLSSKVGAYGIWSQALDDQLRPTGPPTPVRLFETLRFSMATLGFEEIAFEVGEDRIYFTLQETTGEVYLLRPLAGGEDMPG